MDNTGGPEQWIATNSLLLLGIVDLLEEKGILDKDQFLQRLMTLGEESIDIGLFSDSEDQLRGDGGYHCGGQQVTERMARRIELTKENIILDAGCGAGGPARHLAEKFGCSVIGLDREYDRLLIAAMRTRSMALQNKVSFRYGDAAKMPFEDKSFDVVWSQGALPFAGDVQQIFRECHRILRPQGTLAIQTSFFTDSHTADDDRQHPDYLADYRPRQYLAETIDYLKAIGFRGIEAEWIKESVAFYSERFPKESAWFRERKYGSYMVFARKSEVLS
jgi:ubiquinone/menaquinone biosynthesis C-methylase UbiE